MRIHRSPAGLARVVHTLELGNPWRLLGLVTCFALLSQFATAAVDAIPLVPVPATVLLWVPSPSIAVSAWVGLNLGLAVVAMVLVARALATPGSLGLSVTSHAPAFAPAVLACVLSALAFVPLVWGLLHGLASGVTLLLYAVAFLALARGREHAGGMSLALLAPLGLQLVIGPTVFLLAQRRWSALGTLGACVSALAALSIPLVGLEHLRQHVLPLREAGDGATVSGSVLVSLQSMVARLPVVDADGRELLGLALALAMFVVVGLAWRRRISGSRAFSRAFLCFTAAGLMCGLHSAYQDLVILLPAIVVAVGLDRAAVSRAVVGIFAAVGRSRRRARAGPARRTGIRSSSISPWPGLALTGLAVITVVPGAAWVIAGPYALALAPVWALTATAALFVLTVATLPAGIADEIRLPFAWRGRQTPAPDASAVGRPS